MGKLLYTPAGSPVQELSMAVPQKYVDGDSMGYFDLMLFGDIAVTNGVDLRIGKTITVEGTLWSRSFRNRKGQQIKQTKVIVKNIEGENKNGIPKKR